MAVTGTDLIWPFSQDDWEGWWGLVEAVFRPPDRHKHPVAVGCCVASDVYDPEVIAAEGGECVSLQVPVAVARDRLAALGSNRRDADARIAAALRTASAVAREELRSLYDLMAPRSASSSSPKLASSSFTLGFELEFMLEPFDVFASLLGHAPANADLVVTSLRGEVLDLMTASVDEFFGMYDPLDWAVHSRGAATTVVLTEGPFDQEVIQRTINEAYPHLIDYLRFIDVDVPVERSARGLVNFVRALVAARVRDPNFVAVFDNDTEGRNHAAMLAGIGLPAGYRVCVLPARDAFVAVPVELPSNRSSADVNGWGAPIEMYLVEDLGLDAPTLTLSRVGDSYQGVMPQSDKKRIQADYRASSAPPGPALRSIVDAILHGESDLQPPNKAVRRPSPSAFESCD